MKKKATSKAKGQWYHASPKAKQQAILRSRKSYREKAGLALDRSIDLRKLRAFGAMRSVWAGKDALAHLHTYTLADFSNSLGVSNVTLSQWIAAGRMPAPKLRPVKGIALLYPIAFVQEAATIMKAHFARKQYLTAHDRETISALASAGKHMK